MKVSDLISRATYTSGRTTLAVSFILIASSLMDFELDQLPLLSAGELDHSELVTLAIPLVVFLIVTHALNWLSDRTAYVQDFTYNDEGGLAPLHEHLQDLLRDMSKEEFHGADMVTLTELVKELRKRRISFDVVTELSNWSTRVSFYIQHMAFPLSVAVLALCLIFRSLQSAA